MDILKDDQGPVRITRAAANKSKSAMADTDRPMGEEDDQAQESTSTKVPPVQLGKQNKRGRKGELSRDDSDISLSQSLNDLADELELAWDNDQKRSKTPDHLKPTKNKPGKRGPKGKVSYDQTGFFQTPIPVGKRSSTLLSATRGQRPPTPIMDQMYGGATPKGLVWSRKNSHEASTM